MASHCELRTIIKRAPWTPHRVALLLAIASLSLVHINSAFAQPSDFQISSPTLDVFKRAVAEQRNQDSKSAEADYVQVIDRSPEFLPARFNLALVYDAEGRAQAALSQLTFVVDKVPSFPDAQFFLGVENFRLGRYDAAVGAFEVALQQDPSNPIKSFWLGRTYYAQAQFDNAKSAFERTLALNPDHPGALYSLALIQISKQDMVNSERVLSSLVEKYPNTQEFRQALGDLYYMQAQPDRAEQQYKELLRRYPGDPQALSMMGIVLLDRGNAGDAIPCLERALAANSKIGFLQLKLGQALLNSNRADDAIPHLEQAAVLDPKNPTPHFLMWKIYQHKGEANAAATQLENFKRLETLSRQKSVATSGSGSIGGGPLSMPPGPSGNGLNLAIPREK